MARRGKRRKSKGKRKSQQAAPAKTDAKKPDEKAEAKDTGDKSAPKADTKDDDDKKSAGGKSDPTTNTAELDVGWDDDGMDLPEVKSENIPVVKLRAAQAEADAEKKAKEKASADDGEAADKAAKSKDKAAKSDKDKDKAAKSDKDKIPKATAVRVDSSASSPDPDDEAEPVFPPPNEPAPVPMLRTIDNALGIAEQAVLCFLLFSLIVTAVYSAVAGNVFNKSVDWSGIVIQYSVFYVAMFGAALAAQRQRMMAMDVLTRLMGERNKAYLRVGIALLVIFVCYLLISGGMASYANEAKFTDSGEIISVATGLLALPIGATLIAVHYFIHMAIDVRYLALGRVAPQEHGMAVH